MRAGEIDKARASAAQPPQVRIAIVPRSAAPAAHHYPAATLAKHAQQDGSDQRPTTGIATSAGSSASATDEHEQDRVHPVTRSQKVSTLCLVLSDIAWVRRLPMISPATTIAMGARSIDPPARSRPSPARRKQHFDLVILDVFEHLVDDHADDDPEADPADRFVPRQPRGVSDAHVIPPENSRIVMNTTTPMPSLKSDSPPNCAQRLRPPTCSCAQHRVGSVGEISAPNSRQSMNGI
jgi:hypothetical protein